MQGKNCGVEVWVLNYQKRFEFSRLLWLAEGKSHLRNLIKFHREYPKSSLGFVLLFYSTHLTAEMDSKKILVLGSGMVARPCVEYLVRNSKNNVTTGESPLPLPYGIVCH